MKTNRLPFTYSSNTKLMFLLFLALMIGGGKAWGQNEARYSLDNGSTWNGPTTFAAACSSVNVANTTAIIETLVANITMSSGVTFDKNNSNITLRTKDGESFTTVIERSYNGASLITLDYANTTLNLTNITLDGNKSNNYCNGNGGLVSVNDGKLYLKSGATLQNSFASSNNSRGGAVFVDDGSAYCYLEDGALITECYAARNEHHAGGGVCVWNGNFTMNGGTISDCHATQTSGGAISIEHGRVAYINGGLITGCTGKKRGGALEIHGDLYMSGGTITNCSSELGGGINFYNNAKHIYISGNPRIYGNYNSEDGQERNVDIFYHDGGNGITTNCITVIGAMQNTAVVGIYNTDTYNHAGCRFGRYNDGVSTQNFYVFKNDNVQLRGGDYDTDRYLLWACPVARVSTDGEATWTYYDYLIETTGYYYTGGHDAAHLHYGDIPGAFNEANASSATNIIIETLYEGGEFEKVINSNGETEMEKRYTLQEGFTFNNNANITLRTTQDVSWNPEPIDKFTTTLIRGYNGGSLLKLDNASASLTIEKITLDGGHDFTTTPSTGYSCNTNGGLVNVTAGTLNINAGATLQNSKGTGNLGGGIYDGSSGTATISGGTISNCTMSDGRGGGIYKINGTLNVTGGTIQDCSATHGGGILVEEATATINGPTIQRCSTTGWGGGMFSHKSTTTVTGTTLITDCHAGTTDGNAKGGGIGVGWGGTLTFSGGTVSNCTAPYGGGFNVELNGNGNTLNITGGTITGCSATNKGDAVFVENSTAAVLNMSGGSITDNGTSGSHGAVAVEGSSARLNFSGSPVIKNNGTSGSYKNVLLDQNTNAIINVTGAFLSPAEIGVYVEDTDPYNNHGKKGQPFATKPAEITSNLGAFFSDRVESGKPAMRGTTGATNTLVYWSDYIARVKVGDGDWTYHAYLIDANNDLQNGTSIKSGAFNQANTLSGAVTVETLLPTHDHYTLTSGFTFNHSCTSLTIQTTQDDTWNPATGDPAVRFRSTITKNQTSSSMIAVTNVVGTLNVEKLVFNGGGDAGYSGTEGGIFNVQSVSATFTDCDFEHSKVNSNKNGGAVAYNNASGTVRLNGCVFNECQAPTGSSDVTGMGGAFYIGLGDHVIISQSVTRRSRFTSCVANRYGGAVMFNDNDGLTLLVEHTDFVSCEANNANGGAVCSDAISGESYATTINDCTFNNCSAQSGGAVITNVDTGSYDGANIISNSTFTDCSANVDGGAVYANGLSATLAVTGCSFSGCEANSSGGAVYAKNALTITNNGTSTTKFTSCSAGTKGGAIHVGSVITSGSSTVIHGTLTITNNDSSTTEFIGCYSTNDGGAIYTDGALSITGSTTDYVVFETCHTTGGKGGAIRQANGDFSLDYVRFGKRDNGVVVDGDIYSYISGGAVHAESNGNNHVNHCEFLGCKTTKETGTAGEGNGGGLRFSASSASTSMLVENTTFEGCSTYRYGGGLEFEQDAGDITVSNCTFSNCYLQNSGKEKFGGGLYSETPGIISITNCTFNDCHCYNANGGAIGCNNANLTANLTNVNINGHTTGGLATATVNAKNGAGIYSLGYLTINGGTIKNCTASSNGGGIYVAKTLTVSGLTKIDNNTHGTAKAIVVDDVYLDAASTKYVTIDAAGLNCGSHIGIYKTSDYTNDGNGVSQTVIAVGDDSNGNAATNCANAFRNGYFFDDRGLYGVYNLSYTAGSVTYTNDKLYFISDWVGQASTAVAGTDYAVDGSGFVTNVLTNKGLGFLAKDVNSGKNYSDKTVTLSNNIDLSGSYWVPIGLKAMGSCGTPTDKPFAGTFNGQGKVISNMKSILPYQDMGLFGLVQGGTIKNAFVESGTLASTYGPGNMGGLVGELNGGTVTYSEAAVTMTESSESVMGGLVGIVSSSASIHSSMAMPNMTSSHTMGGLVGQLASDCSLKNSFANAKFTVSGSPAVGGLVGVNAGTVDNCYSRKQESSSLGSSNFGWLAGTNSGTISNSYIPSGNTNYLGTSGGTLSNCDTYTPTDLASGKYKYGMPDQKVGTAPNGTPLVDKLNTQATTLGTEYAQWTRTMASPINGDYPVLMMPGTICLGSKDGIFITYNASLNDQITAYNGVSGGGNIYLYDVPSEVTANTDSDVRVYIDENIGILQGTGNVLNARVGVTFDNSDASGQFGKPYDWHMFSSALTAAPLGLEYHTGDYSEYHILANYSTGGNYASSGIPDESVYSDREKMDPPKVTFWQTDNPSGDSYYNGSGDNMIGYFPTDAPYGPWRTETTDNGFDFYSYSEPNCHWVNFKREGAPAGTSTTGSDFYDHWRQDADPDDHRHHQIKYTNEKTLTPGRGYMMAIGQESMLMADGVLNNGDITNDSITFSSGLWGSQALLMGCNLIGNPYQSYLDFVEFAKDGGINSGKIPDKAYYVVDADFSGYITYPDQASSNPEYAPRYLHPHQGFIVAVAEGTTQITFTNAMRVAGNWKDVGVLEHSNFREEHLNYPLVNLLCYDGKGKRDLTTVEIARPELGGARKVRGMRISDALIYAHFENSDYQALFAPEGVSEVPVRFEVFEDGVFTMKWSMYNGDFHYVHLIDNLTGADIDLLNAEEYKFQASTEDYISRFKLVFDVTGIDEPEPEDGPSTGSGAFAFQFGNELIVTGEGTLQLFDLNGRCLLSTRLAGEQSSVSLPMLPKGMYLLRLTGSKQTQVQKMVIK